MAILNNSHNSTIDKKVQFKIEINFTDSTKLIETTRGVELN